MLFEFFIMSMITSQTQCHKCIIHFTAIELKNSFLPSLKYNRALIFKNYSLFLYSLLRVNQSPLNLKNFILVSFTCQ